MQPVGKRTRVVVRKVGPWSVLKFSLLFYLCVMLIVYFALMIIYAMLTAVGAIDSSPGAGVGVRDGARRPEPVVIRWLGLHLVHAGGVGRWSGRSSPSSWRSSTT